MKAQRIAGRILTATGAVLAPFAPIEGLTIVACGLIVWLV